MTTGILNSIRYRDKLFSRLKLLKPGSSRYSNSKCNLDSYIKIVEKIHKNSKKDMTWYEGDLVTNESHNKQETN